MFCKNASKLHNIYSIHELMRLTKQQATKKVIEYLDKLNTDCWVGSPCCQCTSHATSQHDTKARLVNGAIYWFNSSPGCEYAV